MIRNEKGAIVSNSQLGYIPPTMLVGAISMEQLPGPSYHVEQQVVQRGIEQQSIVHITAYSLDMNKGLNYDPTTILVRGDIFAGINSKYHEEQDKLKLYEKEIINLTNQINQLKQEINELNSLMDGL